MSREKVLDEKNSQTLQCENDGALGEIHLCSVISFHWLPEAKAGKDALLPKGTHESRVLQKGIHKNMLLPDRELCN